MILPTDASAVRRVLSATLFITISLPAHSAPSFSFPSFDDRLVAAGTAIAGDQKASLVGTTYQQRGAIWVAQPQDVTESFTVDVLFRITEPFVHPTRYSPNGADGLALVIHNDPRPSLGNILGSSGGQLGYGRGFAGDAIQNSFAAAVRTFTHQRIELFTNALNPNFALRELATDGTPGFARQTGSLGDIVGVPQRLTLSYAAADHSLAVLLNGASIGLGYVPLPAPMSSIVGGDKGYFGITGSTGGYWSRIEVFEFSATLSTRLPGDANHNGVVDHNDFMRLYSNFGKPGTFEDGDFNLNGTVDFPDFQILERNFGLTITGALDPGVGPAPSIPEPAHAAVVLLALSSLRRTKRGQVSIPESTPPLRAPVRSRSAGTAHLIAAAPAAATV
jgi:hypothetical protein